ncbi:MAG TPA: permease, partial [Clostridiaceae bacterium]|nr:permease [Clostridiaceae bacterium]
MVVFQFLNDQLLKMVWLSDLVRYLVENVFGLDMASRLGGSIHFFIYDVIKIFILLSVLIFSISYVQSYFPPERTKKILGRFTGIKGNILGALLGTITPFCSCSSIPLFIGFTSAGLPLGVTFSFLISSPLVDLASVILLASIFNWSTALAYVVVGIVLAVIGGTIIGMLKLEEYVEPFVYSNKMAEVEEEQLTRADRIEFSKSQVRDIVKRVWKYILIGVGIGAAIHNWIPESLISAVLGQDKWYSVLVAALVGVPMYADIFGTLPIAEALVLKGVGLGTALAFMMSVTALSLPSLI